MIDSLPDLKRNFSKARLVSLAEAGGLVRRGGKIECPDPGCDGHGKPDSCSISDGDNGVLWHCKRGNHGGSIVDFIMAQEHCDTAEAIAKLREYDGQIEKPPPPRRAPPPPPAPRLWEALPLNDDPGREYLEGRGLGGAVGAGLVRFNTGTSIYRWLNDKAAEGYRVAVRMYGTDGALVRLQLRSVRSSASPRQLSTPGAYPPGGVAMGAAAEAKTAARVYFSEGIADTLSLQLAGVVAIGAPGADQVPKLVNHIGNAKDRQVVLCAQNDEVSRRWFEEAAGLLRSQGAIVLELSTPAEHKDVADWLKAIGLDDFKRSVALVQARPERTEPGCDDGDAAPVAAAVRVDWQPLIPFDSMDVPKLPAGLLPPFVDRMVSEVANFTQVWPDGPALMSLAVLSALCSRRHRVRIYEGYEEPLNIYGAAVMETGARKSAIFSAITGPLRAAEKVLLEKAWPELARFDERKALVEARKKHLTTVLAKEGDEGKRAKYQEEAERLAADLQGMKRPPVPRLLADDVTPQKLAMLLGECGERMAVFAPEGGIFKTLAGRYSQDGSSDLDLVLKAYSGDSVTVDRVSRATVTLEQPLVSFGLSFQPSVLRTMAETEGAIETGFAARFLYVLPGSSIGERTAKCRAMNPAVVKEYGDRIDWLSRELEIGEAASVLPFGGAAQEVWCAFFDGVEKRLRPGGDLAQPSMKGWALKLPGNVARLAGIFHAVENESPAALDIPGETVQRAVRFGEHLIEHARAAFLSMKLSPNVEDARKLVMWVREKNLAAFTKGELQNSLRRQFESTAHMDQALTVAAERNYVQREPRKFGQKGNQGEKWLVNPQVLVTTATAA